MKYFNFKIYKFSAFIKKFNTIKYNFIQIFKSFNTKLYNFSKIFKNIKLNQYNILKKYKPIKLRRQDIYKVFKLINLKKLNILKIYKYVNYKKYKEIYFYIVLFLFLTSFGYLSIPIFFNYDKAKITNYLCGNFDTKCLIKGEIKYSIIPSPRLKINKFIIYNSNNNKKDFLNAEKVELKIPINSILSIKDLNFTKIILRNPKFNINLDTFEKYSKKLKNFKKIPLLKIENATLTFLEKNEYILDIKKANLTYKSTKKDEEVILKGNFLNDEVYINFKNNDKNKKVFIFKLINSNFLTKINFFETNQSKKVVSGEALIKKSKNKITSNFDYYFIDKKVVFKESNIKNSFLDGKFTGKLEFLPFFNFNLNLDLSGLNFNSIRSYLSSLENKYKKNFFKLNKKINGKLSFSSNKVYSKNSLVDSFESRLQFINGNIVVEQLLLNLGKLGAADISGTIQNTEKYSNFKFENNIFIDDKKRFYRKFSIFNKEKKEPANLFISGNFDLVKLNMHFNEIFTDKKITEDDLNFIQSEFNNILLVDDYVTLFDYKKFKKFLKTVLPEIN